MLPTEPTKKPKNPLTKPYKTIIKKSPPSQNSKINPRDRLKNIMTTTEKENLKKPEKEKFDQYWDSTINYSELHKTMMFYPKLRKPGPKVIFLPGAKPMTLYNYFIHGLTDTIYIQDMKEVSEFPPKAQFAIRQYYENFAKGREIFLKTYSSYAVFSPEGELLAPSICLAKIGVSNQEYPTRDEISPMVPTIESYAGMIAGVYRSLLRLAGNGQIRINYFSKTLLIYSMFTEKLDEAGIQTLLSFQQPFEQLEGLLTNLPEEIKKQVCRNVARAKNHHCKYCEDHN